MSRLGKAGGPNEPVARFAETLVVPKPALPRQSTASMSPSGYSPLSKGGGSGVLYRVASAGLALQNGSGLYGSAAFGTRSVLQQVLETSWETEEEHLEQLVCLSTPRHHSALHKPLWLTVAVFGAEL